jgi:uncharacterized membrane protein YgcG
MNGGMRVAAAACVCLAAVWAADWKALKRLGYVSDFAGAVDSDSRREVDAYCAALEKSTGARVSLVIVDSLQREPVNAVARAIFEGWGGASAATDRALLLIAVRDRRDSLVASRDLEPILNADAVDGVLRETRPALSRKHYGRALMAAADEIGSRIASARGKTIGVRLPQRAHRTFEDSVPWPLIVGAVPIIGLLIWLLRRPHHPMPPRETA